MSQPDVIFAYMIPPGSPARTTMLLAESLRAFGGEMAGNEIWAFLPQLEQTFPEQVWSRLNDLKVRPIPFQLPPYALGFPFAAKVFAAGLAEQKAENQAELLCWMDHDTLFLQEPSQLLLAADKRLGCCPVHHTLIGSRFDQPLDAYWSQVYKHCQVNPEKAFPVTTIVDNQVLRPYYNAGLLVVRPEDVLLRAWQGAFFRYYIDPVYEPFYRQSELYRTFIHQSILAGIIINRLDQPEILELPFTYNYPLHLQQSFPVERRARVINTLASCRYENIFNQPDWKDQVPVEEPLTSWLHAKIM
jgi:hypothetical protein